MNLTVSRRFDYCKERDCKISSFEGNYSSYRPYIPTEPGKTAHIKVRPASALVCHAVIYYCMTHE